MIQQIAAPTALQLLVPHLLCFSIQNEGNMTKQPEEWMEEIARLHNHQQIKKQQDTIARLQADISHSHNTIHNKEEWNKRLEEQVQDATTAKQQLEQQFQQREANITDVIRELEKEINDLKNSLTNGEVVTLVDEVARLEEEKKQCQTNVEEGNLDLNNLTGQVYDIQNALESKRRNADNLTRYLKAKDYEIQELDKEVEELKKQLDLIPILKNMRPSEKDDIQLKAVEEGNVTMVDMLVQMGANLSATDGFGNTPLHRAARRGSLDIAKILLDHGANPEERDVYGNTPLIWAAWQGHVDVCMLLLDRGAQINARSSSGSTPLHYAAFYGKLEIARLLVQRGAEVNAMDQWGRTPRQDAISNRHWALGEFLRTLS